MQATDFLKLKEGQVFTYTNDEGMCSHWLITGAMGTDMIDAECTDDCPNQIKEQIFSLGDAQCMDLLPSGSKWVVTNGQRQIGIFRFKSDAEANLKPGFWMQKGSR